MRKEPESNEFVHLFDRQVKLQFTYPDSVHLRDTNGPPAIRYFNGVWLAVGLWWPPAMCYLSRGYSCVDRSTNRRFTYPRPKSETGLRISHQVISACVQLQSLARNKNFAYSKFRYGTFQ